MRVLVTGGAGYIGSHTLVALVEAGHEPFVVDSFVGSTPAALDGVAAILGAPVPFERLDVRDTPALARLCAAFRPEAAIHFAGLKSVAESGQVPLDYYEVNVGGTLSLVRALDTVGCRRLVFSSSATVYGEPRRLPIDEDHPLSAINPYGRSKLMAEDILRDASLAEPDRAIALLRYFNPVGAHPSALIGERPSGVPANLCPFVADVAAGLRPEVGIFGDDWDTPDGTGVRDYIHVMDLAEAHVAAIAWAARARGARAFNIGVGRGHSVREMIAAFEIAAARPVPARVLPRRTGDVAACVADPGRAAHELTWAARRDLSTMVVDAWRWRERVGLS